MKKLNLSLMAILVLAAFPAMAGDDHGHAHTDDHSMIKPLDISADEALKTIQQGIVDLSAQIDAAQIEQTKAVALKVISAVKTLEKEPLNDRQKSALKQLEKQIDDAKHAAEEKDFAKAKSSAQKAQSALKLYEAMK
jgi:hypothetical protein